MSLQYSVVHQLLGSSMTQVRLILPLCHSLDQAVERLVIATVPLPSAILLTWITSVISGIDNAPYYCLLFLYIHYCLLGLPIQSSFSTGKCGTAEVGQDYVCGRIENAAHTVAVMLLPSLFHVAIYHRVLFSITNVVNLVILICLPGNKFCDLIIKCSSSGFDSFS